MTTRQINIDTLYDFDALPSSVYMTPDRLLPLYSRTRVYALMKAIHDARSAVVDITDNTPQTPTTAIQRIISGVHNLPFSPGRTRSSQGICPEACVDTTCALRILSEYSRGFTLHSNNPDRVVRLDDYPGVVYTAHEETNSFQAWDVPGYAPAGASYTAENTGLFTRMIPSANRVSEAYIQGEWRVSLTRLEPRYYLYTMQVAREAYGRPATQTLRTGRPSEDTSFHVRATFLAKATRSMPQGMIVPVEILSIECSQSQYFTAASLILSDTPSLAYLDEKYGTSTRTLVRLTQSPVEVYFNRRSLNTAEMQLSANMTVNPI